MQAIEITQTFSTASRCMRAGSVQYVDDADAGQWIGAGLARPTDRKPEYIERMLERLNHGADQPCLFLPFCGEFGHLIMTHIRQVHFHRATVKVVCCRPGEEVLFPSAAQCITNWADPVADADRIATLQSVRLEWPSIVRHFPGFYLPRIGRLTPEQELYAIEPTTPIPFNPVKLGLQADVVIGVRNRAYAPERNWPHWHRLAETLSEAGWTFAVIGDRLTSYDLPGQVCHSGDFGTDAAIELLQNCRLYIGTDSGSSHLAATVGARMLVFREEQSGSRNLFPRMQQVNPRPMHVVEDGWTNPARVIDDAMVLTRIHARGSDV